MAFPAEVSMNNSLIKKAENLRQRDATKREKMKRAKK